MTEAVSRMDARSAPRWQAMAVLVLGACALAFTPIFMRMSGVGPAAAGFWRLFWAIPFLLPLLALPSVRGAGIGRPNLILAGAAAFFALDLVFWHFALTLTSVANATTLSNLSPVFVVIGAWILFRERPRPLFLAGLALALSGVALMALSGDGAKGSNPLRGDLLAVVAAAWYGAYFLTVRHARDRISATGVMLWTSMIGAALLLAAALIMGERILPLTAGGWAACIGLGFVHFLGQGAIAWALGRLPAATASVVILLQPVIAALLAWMLFAEPVGRIQALGGLLALAGVVAAQLSSVRRTPQEPAG